MSSKKRTYDTDEITLRKIFAKSFVDNTNIPAMRVLTSDGAGSAYWGNPSTLGMNPSFNQINTAAGNFKADLSYNVLTITTNNIGSAQGPGTNNLVLYNQSFNQVDVSGNNTLYAFNSNTQTQQTNLRFVGTNGINIRSDSGTNTVFFDSIGVPVSTSLYSFQKAEIITNTSTITGGISSLQGTFLNAASPSAALTFVGLGDINLFTDSFTNAIYFGLNQSTGTVSSLTSLVQGISTGYVRLQDFSTGVGSVSTIGFSNFSTTLSTSYGINSNLSITVYNLPFNQYTLLAQYNTGVGILANGISTISTTYTPLPALFSTSIGINNRISTFAIPSSVCTVNVYGGNVTGFTANTVIYDPADLSSFSTSYGIALNTNSTNTYILTTQVSTLSTLALRGLSSLSTAITQTFNTFTTSTVLGLGTYGYISSLSLYSTVVGLGSARYVSTPSLTSTVAGLGTAGYISSTSLFSTTDGLGTLGYISSSSLYSSLIGLGSAGYISSLSSQSMSTTTISVSSILFRDTLLQTDQLLAVKNNQLQLNGSPITGGGGGGISFFSTSFTSSIFYRGNASTILATNNGTVQAGFFSTASVYFDTFSSYITSTTRLTIDYYYNLRLKHWFYSDFGENFNIENGIYNFSTGIMYNSLVDPDSLYYDTGVPNITSNLTYAGSNSNLVFYSNVISRRQRFQLSTGGVMSDFRKPVEVYHLIDRFFDEGDASNYYYSGFSTNYVQVIIASTTAITVGIQN